MEPSASTPIATWNPARDVWETPQCVLCGHWDVWRETWPPSGMTRSGSLYVRPTSVPVTSAHECFWLPTPRATQGGSATETVSLLPTPTTEPATGNGHARNLSTEIFCLPRGRPTASAPVTTVSEELT